MTDIAKGKRLDICLGGGNSPHQVMVQDHDTGALTAGMSKEEAINRLLTAPSLLESLEAFVADISASNSMIEVSDVCDDHIDALRAAIASARGATA